MPISEKNYFSKVWIYKELSLHVEISLEETLLNECGCNSAVHTYRSYNYKLELHLQMVEIQTLIQFKKAVQTYTGRPRRKGPNYGRVFLRSNYTDITQNTYIQSW
jgi:hypothetical protein